MNAAQRRAGMLAVAVLTGEADFAMQRHATLYVRPTSLPPKKAGDIVTIKLASGRMVVVRLVEVRALGGPLFRLQYLLDLG